jgi:hypothetical protein
MDEAHLAAASRCVSLNPVRAGLSAVQNPKHGQSVPTDDYIAYCVLQEFRRVGWIIVTRSG